jgi:hypothetical protein
VSIFFDFSISSGFPPSVVSAVKQSLWKNPEIIDSKNRCPARPEVPAPRLFKTYRNSDINLLIQEDL